MVVVVEWVKPAQDLLGRVQQGRLGAMGPMLAVARRCKLVMEERMGIMLQVAAIRILDRGLRLVIDALQEIAALETVEDHRTSMILYRFRLVAFLLCREFTVVLM